MEKLNEEQVDSVAQATEPISMPDVPEEFKRHYTQIVLNNHGMRVEVEKDFIWVRQKMIQMREATHTLRISILNEMIEYFDKVIPEMAKIRIAFKEQIDGARKLQDESKTPD